MAVNKACGNIYGTAESLEMRSVFEVRGYVREEGRRERKGGEGGDESKVEIMKRR